MKKPLAELVGTYLLVFLGTSAAVAALSTNDGKLSNAVVVEIGLTFGLALVAIAYAFGPISGAHVNPAVTFGMVVAGKMKIGEAIPYWIAQFAGGILAALTVMLAYGETAKTFNLGANGPGKSFGVQGAIAFEIVSTMLFFLVIYGAAASKKANAAFAGIPISGSSLNPARDFGPALLSGGTVLSGVWVYFVGPLAGALLGGIAAKILHEGD
jgi:aquaporin Z